MIADLSQTLVELEPSELLQLLADFDEVTYDKHERTLQLKPPRSAVNSTPGTHPGNSIDRLVSGFSAQLDT